MKIETRFNIGDEVFFLNDGKIISNLVNSFSTSTDLLKTDKPVDNKTRITYFFQMEKNSVMGYEYKSVEEKDAFTSREELIKSL
jgi:hypothetical protein